MTHHGPNRLASIPPRPAWLKFLDQFRNVLVLLGTAPSLKNYRRWKHSARPTSLPDFLPLLTPAALCADSRLRDGQLIGDPTEGALLALAAKGGVDQETAAEHSPRLAEIPFVCRRRRVNSKGQSFYNWRQAPSKRTEACRKSGFSMLSPRDMLEALAS